MSNTRKHLNQSLQLAQTHRQKASFVFDLDSTLFLTKYRTQAILKEFIKQKLYLKKEYPLCFQKLEQAEVHKQDYFSKTSLLAFGIKDEKFIKHILTFWKKHFFTDSYISYDQPYPLAVSFVQYIQKFQSSIYYLTARSLEKTYKATYQSLKQWDFPLEKEEHLILKPTNPQQRDREYKLEEIKKLTQKFEHVLFFDNEPTILNFINNNSLKNVSLFWINSSHSHKETISKEIPAITTDYSFDKIK